MSSRVVEKDMGWDRIQAEMEKAGGAQVKVGVLGDSGEDEDGADMVMIAASNEFGAKIPVTDKMRGYFAWAFGINLKQSTTVIEIPARSFIRASFDDHSADISKTKERLWNLVLSGKLDVERALKLLGEEHQAQVQQYMRDLKEPENSDLTKDQKGSSNPLVNESRLISSVRYEVENV